MSPEQTEQDQTEPEDAVLADAVEAGPAEPADTDTLDVDDVMPPASAGALAPLRDPVGRFLAEARALPPAHRRGGAKARQGRPREGDMDAARRLVVHNLRLVISIAYQYRRAWANILDLFQEGSVGLMEAVKRWEPSLGPRFGTYAAYWIRAYVLKFLMTNSRLIHVGNTRAGRKLFFRLEKERQKLLAAGFEPTPKLLAAKLDVDERDLDEVRQHLESREVSIDPGGAKDERRGDVSAGRAHRCGRALAGDRGGARRAGRRRARLRGRFREGLKDERERAVWHEHLATEEPVPLGELGVSVRGLQAADGADRRSAEEALSQRDCRQAGARRSDRLAPRRRLKLRFARSDFQRGRGRSGYLPAVREKESSAAND